MQWLLSKNYNITYCKKVKSQKSETSPNMYDLVYILLSILWKKVDLKWQELIESDSSIAIIRKLEF